jgi:uncharacterized membrane protein SpoIIM required for sporulation
MKQGGFESRRKAAWDEFERLVTGMEKRKPQPGTDEFPRRFREICADLALARHRMYRGLVSERLNQLVIRGYKFLYRSPHQGAEAFARFAMADFPAAVRREWRLFALCSALFWVPFFGMMLAVQADMDWAQAILGPQVMSQLDSMYGEDSNQIAYLREEFGSNFMMFGFYIQNNVSIDFRIFAGGMAFGLGTIFFLVHNGLAIGASAGYVQAVGNPEAFWTFVAGHSSFELTGMVIAGVAGLRLGLALLHPGRLPRGAAIAHAARQALPLILGAGIMTVLAAVIEGFWSAQPFPAGLKYSVGIFFWLLHAVYFILLGRGRE